MNIKILHIIVISSCFCFYISTSDHDTQAIALDIWSQLDLIQAINVSHEQKEFLAISLARQALQLYTALQIQAQQETVKQLCRTLKKLRKTSAKVFSCLASPAVHTLLFVLDTLIAELEVPGDITDERSTKQISLKHIFSP